MPRRLPPPSSLSPRSQPPLSLLLLLQWRPPQQTSPTLSQPLSQRPPRKTQSHPLLRLRLLLLNLPREQRGSQNLRGPLHLPLPKPNPRRDPREEVACASVVPSCKQLAGLAPCLKWLSTYTARHFHVSWRHGKPSTRRCIFFHAQIVAKFFKQHTNAVQNGTFPPLREPGGIVKIYKANE